MGLRDVFRRQPQSDVLTPKQQEMKSVSLEERKTELRGDITAEIFDRMLDRTIGIYEKEMDVTVPKVVVEALRRNESDLIEVALTDGARFEQEQKRSMVQGELDGFLGEHIRVQLEKLGQSEWEVGAQEAGDERKSELRLDIDAATFDLMLERTVVSFENKVGFKVPASMLEELRSKERDLIEAAVADGVEFEMVEDRKMVPGELNSFLRIRITNELEK